MSTVRAPLARWVLLLAVIAGVFGMHVLTAGDGPGHGLLPGPAMVAGHHGGVEAAPPALEAAAESSPLTVALDPMATPGPSGFGHDGLAGCILFLVIGGAALLLVALAGYVAGVGEHERRGNGLLRELRRRGPPDGWPRVALSVIRV